MIPQHCREARRHSNIAGAGEVRRTGGGRRTTSLTLCRRDPRLILVPLPGIVRGGGERGPMRRNVGLTLAVALLAGACSGASKCPKPVVYDDATLKAIQKAIAALPKDSVLHQVMTDYENERDDLRFCK